MKPGRWQQVERIFNEVLTVPFEQQESYLIQMCGSDAQLQGEVFSLLEEAAAPHEFLDTPVFELGLKLLFEEEENENLLAPGTKLENFTIIKLISTGGLSEVYLAQDDVKSREAAVKILRQPNETDYEYEEFAQKIQRAASIKHQNVARIYQPGVFKDKNYIVMEYVSGNTLRQIIRRKVLTQPQIVKIAAQISKGLSAFHRQGMIHLDIKPENIIVTADETIKIVDFGQAKLLTELVNDSDSSTNINKETQLIFIGTTFYMSPEQIRQQDISFSSDLWSCGVILYEMLNGLHPFQGLTDADVMRAITQDDFKENDAIDPRLRQIIRKCLAKNPAERFQTADDLTLALDDVYKELVQMPAIMSEPKNITDHPV